jgi:hypothetical protein
MLNSFNKSNCSVEYKSQISDSDSVSLFRWKLRKEIYNTLDNFVNLLSYPALGIDLYLFNT